MRWFGMAWYRFIASNRCFPVALDKCSEGWVYGKNWKKVYFQLKESYAHVLILR